MKPTRRSVAKGLLGAAAVWTGGPVLAAAATGAGATRLEARQAAFRLAGEQHPEATIWGYDGGLPGPEIRVRRGARIARRFVNSLPQASSVHWHGIRIDNAMDGVVGLTQDAVAPQADFLYDFVAPDAGTYWYHPHNRSYEQLARGLYGALIVEEPEGAPDIDGEEVLLIDDWRLTRDAQISEDFGNMHEWAHAGRIGNWITVNGDGAWTRRVKRHSRHRLRLVNTATARVFAVDPQGLEGWVIALDGMPLAEPAPLGRIVLAPAQRVDLLVDIVAEEGGEAFLLSVERDGGYALATFKVDAAGRQRRLPPPAALPPNGVPALGPLNEARSAELLMEGGAMGGMRGGMMGGRMTGMREMVEAGKAWAFNGRADMPEEPLIDAARGETWRMKLRNDTAWPHAIHLHGHHFRTVGPDGGTGPLRDTVLLDPRDAVDIAFVADNPGDWLLHCHMLEHSASGMMTWFRVG